MWKLAFISVGVLIAVLLSYLPYLQDTTHFTSQRTQLQLEINNSQTHYLDRMQADRAFVSHSARIYYDETEQSTQLSPFSFTSVHSGQTLEGYSERATLTQDIIRLEQNVTLKQAEGDHLRQFSTEQLIIDSKHSLLFSPSPVQVEEGQQITSANRLIGNYKEGWYEFKQSVQSHWE